MNWNNFFLGLVVVILPFVGLPAAAKNILWVVVGVLISLFSLVPQRANDEIRQ